jgi:hypothetical protein
MGGDPFAFDADVWGYEAGGAGSRLYRCNELSISTREKTVNEMEKSESCQNIVAAGCSE